MVFSELKRTQNRYSYLLNPLPESFENLVRQCGLSLAWDDFPIFDLTVTTDVQKLTCLYGFFDKTHRQWLEETRKAEKQLFQVTQ